MTPRMGRGDGTRSSGLFYIDSRFTSTLRRPRLFEALRDGQDALKLSFVLLNRARQHVVRLTTRGVVQQAFFGLDHRIGTEPLQFSGLKFNCLL